ncbi:phosphate acetyltransferase [Wigglesworthia glossinidia endosymbiont of Glossina morsitans morsitans (Yale colony)]|uniref:Phosphate acetyltransferase n=1 Tax=Wigglesworthia glossinidia endosymbiont of Glossina morsitans morsitans (Yale colony) TaxID=1142511 RepID=H6Q5D4_WIGGL|nr:phosphate acetyltransferase [Wigglesworthia glossinidia]AFA41417.1 phosphate acetyltransferase [Wigglesworthia glossinidia endosymbiont of Glossina morsitans morsitans (Yale colony)]
MSRTIMLIPTEKNIGLSHVFSGIMHAISQASILYTVFRPIDYIYEDENKFDIIKYSSSIYNISYTSMRSQYSLKNIIQLLCSNQKHILMENIIETFYQQQKNSAITLIPGISIHNKYFDFMQLNCEIAKMLNADIILISKFNKNYFDSFVEYIEFISLPYGGTKNKRIKGVILNQINFLKNSNIKKDLDWIRLLEVNKYKYTKKIDKNLEKLKDNNSIPIIAKIPWDSNLDFIRLYNLKKYFNAKIINNYRKDLIIKFIAIFQNSERFLYAKYYKESLLIILTNQINKNFYSILEKFQAILLVGSENNYKKIQNICNIADNKKIILLSLETDYLSILKKLKYLKLKYLKSNQDIFETNAYIAKFFDNTWISSLNTSSYIQKIDSPQIFQYNILQLARKELKNIILPEACDLRILKAANICAKKNIARCTLLGDPKNIQQIAYQNGIVLEKNIHIVNPLDIQKKYIPRIMNLRKKKEISEKIAIKQLKNNIILATLMLDAGVVDGLVAGAISTTADTLRPAFQFIKTTQKNSLISSIFFMLLPEKTVIYGDCAINVDPNAYQLAEIAIQSANSAIQFGIDPKIAMISYSTGYSGTGISVEKVRQATCIVKSKYPEFIIDGPLQYDAAMVQKISQSKSPHSCISGNATVLIFPDLNTGNTTYKAVQRSANISCIGPILQGIRKPVNDLSRGASVEDIIYVIAVTAIQSMK